MNAKLDMLGRFNGLGLNPTDILTPSASIDITRWAVVACDQFTAQLDYWKAAESIAGDGPSTLNMILPEVYLAVEDSEAIERRSGRLIDQMKQASLDEALFTSIHGFVLVERTFTAAPGGHRSPPRIGLMAAVDLECYDYTPGSTSAIRPTEGTIIERLPPRAAIRGKAALELPHILLLIQDDKRSVIEPLYHRRDDLRPLYDAPLMLDGGRVRGWAVDNADDIEAVAGALAGLPLTDGIRAAVGDGNHSLAAARSVWLSVREGVPEAERAAHPLRYALAEVCNVYDDGITFEPIHRIVYGVGRDAFIDAYAKWAANADAHYDDARGCVECVECVGDTGGILINIAVPENQITVGAVQDFLDNVLPLLYPNMTIDYIHGGDVVRDLCSTPDRVGLLLPSLAKANLFPAIAGGGVLPRKTFSMGHAREKRYYLEVRRIG